MKGKSILEVLIVIVLKFVILGWLFAQLERAGLSRWGQLYLNGFFMVAIPIAILLIARRDRAAYGFTLKGWQANLQIGLTCYLLRLIPWGLGFGIMSFLHLSYNGPGGALILAISYCFAIALLLRILNARERAVQAGGSQHASATGNVLTIIGLLFFPIVVALSMRRLSFDVVSTVIWQFVFSGFGEEIYYRGYIQSRINQEFGRPYQAFGVHFGPGLIIASLYFGLSHALNLFHPFAGQYGFALWWGVWTCFSGLFLGIVREKAESLLAPGIAHGLPDAVGEALALVFGWNL